MSDLQAELESPRQENARLRKLLKLTDREAAPAHGTQTAWFVALLGAQVHALRLLLLRLSAIVAIALIAVGVVLPAWSERPEDEPTTVRVITAGFMGLSQSFDEFAGAATVGFLGLLLVLLLLCGLLVSSVMAGNGRAQGARVRGVIETLAVVGSVIATLFSLVAAGSDESGVDGGVGPVVLLVGVIAAVVILRYRPWQDLWIDQTGRR